MAERNCLKCGNKFESLGISNRICPKCKNLISGKAIPPNSRDGRVIKKDISNTENY